MVDVSELGPRGSFTPLEVERCWELAASEPVGRLGLIVDGSPKIFPLNHTTSDGAVYFRTSAYGVIARYAEGAEVVFEVDHIFAADWSGWSVQIAGTAHRVEDAAKLDRLWSPNRPHPWADGTRNVWVEIVAREITGRAVRS